MLIRINSARAPRYSGSGYIGGESPGLVTVAGAPASRRVILASSPTMRPIEDQLSAEDGTYRFNNLNPHRKFAVLAVDHQLQFNAVIRDNITPAEET